MRLIKNTIFASLGLFGISCISIELFRLYLPELLNSAIKELLSNDPRILNPVKGRRPQILTHHVHHDPRQHLYTSISAYDETLIFTGKLFKEIINDHEIFDIIVRYFFKSIGNPLFELILEETMTKIADSNLIVDGIRDVVRGTGRYEKFKRNRLALNRLKFNTKWKSYRANTFLIPLPCLSKYPLGRFKEKNLNMVENFLQSGHIKEVCKDLSNNLLDEMITLKENNKLK